MLSASRKTYMHFWERPMKSANGVHQNVSNQILTGDDMQLLRRRLLGEQVDELGRPVEECLGMGKKRLPLRREGCPPAQAAALFIKLDTKPCFERQQTTPQPLLRDIQLFRRSTQAALSGQ